MKKVLIVEDDPQITEVLKYYLDGSGGYETLAVDSAQKALDALEQGAPDVILMDIMLSDLDGISLCERIRQRLFVPVLFISCIDNDSTIVQALNMGGDDYIIKPFNGSVLLARMESVLRRTASRPAEKPVQLKSKSLTLNTQDHSAYKNGKPLRLAPTEFQLLRYFMSHPGQVLDFEGLYQSVWKQESNGDVRTLFVHVRNLRKKIEDDDGEPKIIKTVFKSGYLFQDD